MVFEEKTANQNKVYTALVNGLKEMEKQCVDRIILTLYKSEPSKDATGRWLTLEEDTNYYPFEMLVEREQKMISDKRHYTVVALVVDNVGGVVNYNGKGVIYSRTHLNLFLPKLKLDYYLTEGCMYTLNNQEFAEIATEYGLNKDNIYEIINNGIQEYRSKTRELMQKAGVYDALKKMEERMYSPFEEILEGIKQNIASAKRLIS